MKVRRADREPARLGLEQQRVDAPVAVASDADRERMEQQLDAGGDAAARRRRT